MGISHNFSLGFIFKIYFSSNECIASFRCFLANHFLKLVNGWFSDTPTPSPSPNWGLRLKYHPRDAFKESLYLLKRFLFFSIFKLIRLYFTKRTYGKTVAIAFLGDWQSIPFKLYQNISVSSTGNDFWNCSSPILGTQGIWIL